MKLRPLSNSYVKTYIYEDVNYTLSGRPDLIVDLFQYNQKIAQILSFTKRSQIGYAICKAKKNGQIIVRGSRLFIKTPYHALKNHIGFTKPNNSGTVYTKFP